MYSRFILILYIWFMWHYSVIRKVIFALIVVAMLSMENDELPPVNAKVIAYVNKVMGQKVDRGECWDLVKEALNNSEANWSPTDEFGKKFNPQKEMVLPGDIVAFINVKFTTEDGITWTFAKHYAIIYTVQDKSHFTMANQNVSGKRKVVLSELSLVKLKGNIYFFRPQAK